ncbi:uroporphyrinogen decarboxylase family protein [Chloroflexota bacterium]
MNSRDRILTALEHREPDRIPLDLGGTTDSTISALGYQALRSRLGLEPSATRVADIYQYTAVVEDDVRQTLDVDTLPVLDEPTQWRAGTLTDGSPAEFPDRFRPQQQADGSQVVRDGAGTVVLKMPAGGYYFDPVHSPLAEATSVQEIDACLEEIETYDRPAHLDKSYEDLAERARWLKDHTDSLLVGYFGGHILQAAQSLRGWETFLVDLLVNRRFAEALLDRLTEANIRRFERYAETVGRYVDVVQFEDDLGMQDRPLLRPELYRSAVKPYHARLFRYARSRCEAYLLLHSDGAVSPLIPDFIEMGIDALNPVQTSAVGMQASQLKREFGREITFWGGGCDSQVSLPFGTAAKVADEVKRRIDELAPGGGYVFAPIHNVQAEVPAGNVVTMFQTAREYGVY